MTEYGACPDCRDILIDTISYLSCQFIEPSAVWLLRPMPSTSASNSDNNPLGSESAQNIMSEARPTLDQL